MKLILTDISPTELFRRLDQFVIEIDALTEWEKDPPENIAALADQYISDLIEFINRHIPSCVDEITALLDIEPVLKRTDEFYLKYEISRPDENQEEKYRLINFNISLKKVISYLSVADPLTEPDNPGEINSHLEKNDFVLNKLYKLFGDGTYSIARILDVNDIKYRNGETREMAVALHKKGYVIHDDHRYGTSDDVKISVKGAAYVERKNKPKKGSQKAGAFDKKLDTILEHLTKLGYGQEIIFNEIEELRELQHKLSKKSWAQLLKGKLFDLALKELINTDTASAVYDYLTDNSSKLLK